jgi:hypothetical protein
MISFGSMDRFRKPEPKAPVAPDERADIDRNIDLMLKDEKMRLEIRPIVEILEAVADLVRSEDSGFQDLSEGLSIKLYRKGNAEVAIDTSFLSGKQKKPVPYLRVEFRFQEEGPEQETTTPIPFLRKGFIEELPSPKSESVYSFIIRKNQDTGKFITKFWTALSTHRGLTEEEISQYASVAMPQITQEDWGQRSGQTQQREEEDPEKVLLNLKAVSRRLADYVAQRK